MTTKSTRLGDRAFDRIWALCEKASFHWRPKPELVKALAEAAEFQVEVAKWLNDQGAGDAVIAEAADNIIMSVQAVNCVGGSLANLLARIEKKVARTEVIIDGA